MKKTRLLSLALAGFCFTSIRVSYAATIVEDFAKDPLETGWQVFGDASHFQRDAVNEHLAVTWDSSRPNSYFYVPLGTMLSRNTDFSFAFDLHLTDAISGNEPGKTGGMQLAIGLLNLAGATSPAFMRGAFGNAPNVVEFDYFPAGFYEGFGDVSATTTPTFISGSGFAFAPTLFGSYLLELPADQWMRVALTYTAADQKLVFTVTADGVPLAEFPEIVLDSGENSAFESTDDFQVDAFSISSYGSAGSWLGGQRCDYRALATDPEFRRPLQQQRLASAVRRSAQLALLAGANN